MAQSTTNFGTTFDRSKTSAMTFLNRSLVVSVFKGVTTMTIDQKIRHHRSIINRYFGTQNTRILCHHTEQLSKLLREKERLTEEKIQHHLEQMHLALSSGNPAKLRYHRAQLRHHRDRMKSESHPVPSNYVGPTKPMVIFRHKGTPHEERITTNIVMHWCPSIQDYVTIPQ